MTAVLPEAAALDLAGLTDEHLAEVLSAALETGDSGTVAAIEAEAGRRDAADRAAEAARRAREARTARLTAYYETMHAQYLAASDACRGRLLSAAGMRAGIRETQLWQLGERDAMRYASEELRDWWHYNGRLTYREWEAGTSEAAAQRYEQDRQDREAVEPEQPGPAEPEAATVTTEPERTERMKDACKHLSRTGPAICEDCPRHAAQPVPAVATDDRAVRRAERAQRAAVLRARIIGQPAPATVTPATVGAEVALRPAPVVLRARPEVDGAEALRFSRAFLQRFGYWPSESALTVATLWAAHTHARDRSGTLVFDATPRLALLSLEPDSGKSTLLELIARICPRVPGMDVEPSEAVVAASIGREKVTLFLDEADILFGAGKRKASIRAILDAGYTRNGTWPRMRGGAVERVPCFGPVAFAGLDVVEKSTGDSLKALLSRCIKLRVRPKPADMDLPLLTRRDAAASGQIRGLLATWAAEHLEELADASETAQPPRGLHNRAGQITRALLAVAEVAGGEWPDLAAAAIADLMTSAPAETAEPEEDDITGLRDLVASWA